MAWTRTHILRERAPAEDPGAGTKPIEVGLRRMGMRLGAEPAVGWDVADAPEDADLAAFCRAQWPRLVGVLTLYSGNRAVAEELAQ